ncbi:MAG TPA: hypothetical protein VG476_02455 [Acidimicrobiales bacterium]|nr:hypothetical protein [Acidimicrobiales bacterium]
MGELRFTNADMPDKVVVTGTMYDQDDLYTYMVEIDVRDIVKRTSDEATWRQRHSVSKFFGTIRAKASIKEAVAYVRRDE